MAKRKSSSGRQKIPIEKIPKKSHLQVTFSKRRSGLFKKASELCTLCGVEIAIIVFSPADKAFSFGHPEVESIIDRYLSQNSALDSSASSSTTHQLVEAHRNANVRNLNMQLTQILNQLEIEKKRGEDLDQMRKARQRQFWWEIPIDELGFNELQHLMLSLDELKKHVAKYASKMMIMMEQNNTSTTTITGPVIIGPNNNNHNNGFGCYDTTYETKPHPAEIIYANNVSGTSFRGNTW